MFSRLVPIIWKKRCLKILRDTVLKQTTSSRTVQTLSQRAWHCSTQVHNNARASRSRYQFLHRIHKDYYSRTPPVLGLKKYPITGELKPAILAFQADVQQHEDSSEV